MTASAASTAASPFDAFTLAGLRPSWARGFICPLCGAKPGEGCRDRTPDDHHAERIRVSFVGQVIPIEDALPRSESLMVENATLPAADPLLTPGEVATLFRVDPKTVGRWAQAGRLPCVRTPGGHRRYRTSDVKALLAPQVGRPAEAS